MCRLRNVPRPPQPVVTSRNALLGRLKVRYGGHIQSISQGLGAPSPMMTLVPPLKALHGRHLASLQARVLSHQSTRIRCAVHRCVIASHSPIRRRRVHHCWIDTKHRQRRRLNRIPTDSCFTGWGSHMRNSTLGSQLKWTKLCPNSSLLDNLPRTVRLRNVRNHPRLPRPP